MISSIYLISGVNPIFGLPTWAYLVPAYPPESGVYPVPARRPFTEVCMGWAYTRFQASAWVQAFTWFQPIHYKLIKNEHVRVQPIMYTKWRVNRKNEKNNFFFGLGLATNSYSAPIGAMRKNNSRVVNLSCDDLKLHRGTTFHISCFLSINVNRKITGTGKSSKFRKKQHVFDDFEPFLPVSAPKWIKNHQKIWKTWRFLIKIIKIRSF